MCTGASLQEVVVPVIRINKGRASDVSTVEVDAIVGRVIALPVASWA